MKIFRLMTLAAVLAGALLSTPVSAEDSCTDWSLQTDGTYFRTCVDSNGHQYCQQKDQNGNITVVSCT